MKQRKTIMKETTMQDKRTSSFSWMYFFSSIITGMVGYTINGGSTFWGIVDFIFSPLPWIKWIVCQEVNLTILKETFSWFLK